jgi:hypothetical protein
VLAPKGCKGVIAMRFVAGSIKPIDKLYGLTNWASKSMIAALVPSTLLAPVGAPGAGYQ